MVLQVLLPVRARARTPRPTGCARAAASMGQTGCSSGPQGRRDGAAAPVEGDLLRLHLPILHVHLVAAEDDGDVFAHPARRGRSAPAGCGGAAARAGRRRLACAAPAQVAVPGRDVLVRQPRGHVEHDYGALAVDVVPIAQAAKLLLPGRVPAVEAQLAAVGRKVQRVHLHADRGCATQAGARSKAARGTADGARCAPLAARPARDAGRARTLVLLLELAGQMPLHERGLA